MHSGRELRAFLPDGGSGEPDEDAEKGCDGAGRGPRMRVRTASRDTAGGAPAALWGFTAAR